MSTATWAGIAASLERARTLGLRPIEKGFDGLTLGFEFALVPVMMLQLSVIRRSDGLTLCVQLLATQSILLVYKIKRDLVNGLLIFTKTTEIIPPHGVDVSLGDSLGELGMIF